MKYIYCTLHKFLLLSNIGDYMAFSPTTLNDNSINSTKSKRISFVDIAKAFAIIFVIIEHCKQNNTMEVRTWICSFHMPLFWILSGLTFSSKKYKTYFSFVKSRVKALLIPYYILSLMLLASCTVVFLSFDPAYIVQRIESIFIAKRLSDYYYSMWFIPSLFFSVLIYYFIDKKIKNKYVLFGISISMTALQYFIFKNIKGFYYSIDTIPVVISFLIVGKLLKDFIFSEMSKKKIAVICLVSLIINLISCYFNTGLISYYDGEIQNPVLLYISSVSGSLFVIFVSKLINKFSILEYLGKYTLIIYAFQNSLLIPVSNIIIRKLQTCFSIEPTEFIKIIYVVFSLIFTLATSTIMIEIIKRFFPFAIGGSYKKKKVNS